MSGKRDKNKLEITSGKGFSDFLILYLPCLRVRTDIVNKKIGLYHIKSWHVPVFGINFNLKKDLIIAENKLNLFKNSY